MSEETRLKVAVRLGVDGEMERSVDALKVLVDEGVTAAYLHLGIAYELHGLRLPNQERYDYARFYYEKAYEHGSPHALIGLGRIYYYGLGVCKDYTKSFSFFTEIERNGFASGVAEYYIGRHFENGHGVDKDLARAEFHFRRSVELGYNFGRLGIGDVYRSQGRRLQVWIQRVTAMCATATILFRFGSKSWRLEWPWCAMGPMTADELAYIRAAISGKKSTITV